ncbi:MAG: DUF4038 domain-containing protein [Candidatus Sulfotelmatobacter sp.]
MQKSLIYLCLLCLLDLGTAQAQHLALSPDKKYLVNQTTGQPFFITGEAAWSLLVQLNNADALAYLQDRANKGYNAIIVNLIEHEYGDTECSAGRGNNAGDCPFTGAPFATPNEAYFAHADYVIQEAERLGITVFLYPTYSGYECNAEGWCADIQAASVTTMSHWGTYVANRYKSFSNIFWIIGGDIDPGSYGIKDKLNTVAVAIRAADPNHLMSAHGRPAEAALDIWTGFPWLDTNTEYIESTITAPMAFTQYQRRDFLPFYLTEDYYEGEYSTTAKQLRTESYTAVLSGAYLGAFFGNNPIWCFQEKHAAILTCDAKPSWQSQLNSLGSISHSWFGKLFRSREHWKLVPDIKHTVVTAGYGSGADLTTTARTSDGQSILSFIPNGNDTVLTVNMAKITDVGGKARVWWFNPATGAVVDGGKLPNRGMHRFTAPGAQDWVLVLDSAAAQFPPPGR